MLFVLLEDGTLLFIRIDLNLNLAIVKYISGKSLEDYLAVTVFNLHIDFAYFCFKISCFFFSFSYHFIELRVSYPIRFKNVHLQILGIALIAYAVVFFFILRIFSFTREVAFVGVLTTECAVLKTVLLTRNMTLSRLIEVLRVPQFGEYAESYLVRQGE